ncbi:1,2-phenylacetyl-CoA epoxidase subunit PaaE [Subtercola lobariae]|uniref:Phenylacetic acid degradation protein n=1 Tax=Subtercola lobariae TaxID=1588641 RepID=A0A917EVK7_9MICO|nr:1,2-phenylacetyl-CoA epoxidase subunit PaaE [Subtercola lobariae]GGF11783.1 phenylacetic acid degradation protein [Subtercola lobariae]
MSGTPTTTDEAGQTVGELDNDAAFEVAETGRAADHGALTDGPPADETFAADGAADDPATPARRRATFHALPVSRVRPLTDDSIEVSFDVPDELADAYDYAPGQYIAIRTSVEGEDVRRSYSICQAPVRGELKVAIKRDLGGVFSTWAVENLAAGMELEVMSPEGRFTSQTDLDTLATATHFVGIAAGSGITPMMALIESTLQASPANQFSLVYSNRTAMDTMFVDELADLKDRYPARLALYHVLTRERRSSELLSGRLDAEKFREILGTLIRPSDIDEWFICGPFDLVQLCRDTLTDLGVDISAIRYELFTTGRPDRPAGQAGRPVEVGSDQAVHTISFTLDGTTATVTSPVHSNESILNAALRVRGDVPFACAGGVCGTCRAVVTSGTVDMVENYALEPEELARGYVLTCQAIPTSDAVSVNYDA